MICVLDFPVGELSFGESRKACMGVMEFGLKRVL